MLIVLGNYQNYQNLAVCNQLTDGGRGGGVGAKGWSIGLENVLCESVIYEPMIYTAPYVMLFDAGKSITRVSGRGWTLELESLVEDCEMTLSRQASAIWGPKESRQLYAKVDFIPPVRD